MSTLSEITVPGFLSQYLIEETVTAQNSRTEGYVTSNGTITKGVLFEMYFFWQKK